MESQLMREMRKIYRNLNGIRDMSKPVSYTHLTLPTKLAV